MEQTLKSALMAALFLLLSATPGIAGERITNFISHVIVRPDSVADVTETISVIATGDLIKHGIYRDFPTTYHDKTGNIVTAGFRVKKVMRDNEEIPYKVESRANGKRVYLGDANISIGPGTYTFVLNYEVDRELGYFSDYDEIYWNVTGNGWIFPIDHVTATIELPPEAKILHKAAYTGYSGATGQDYRVTTDNGKITFKTTRELNPNEGLTVAVGWPKGFVTIPSRLDSTIRLLQDNTGLALSLIAFVMLLGYYVVIWRLMRASEPEETIIPLFAPPKDLPVPALSFIYHKGVHSKTLPATIVDMAVKGYLDIVQQKAFFGSHFSLNKNAAPASVLPDVEKITAATLFCQGDHLDLEKKNYLILQQTSRVLKEGLKAGYEDGYFSDNYQFLFIGWAFTVIAGLVVYIVMHGDMTVAPGVALAMTAVLNLIFVQPIKYYTKAGKDLQAAIDGFKMFLSVTEKERFDKLNPPDVTPELFEKYFPFAMALGVEGRWSEKFSQYLAAAGQSMQNYHPRWHQGYAAGGLHQLSADLGSGLSSAISSSSSPPGSSSGSRGGGSSGGGGGGGGGGGF
jgi:uncharacterized membrane protein YgcG